MQGITTAWRPRSRMLMLTMLAGLLLAGCEDAADTPNPGATTEAVAGDELEQAASTLAGLRAGTYVERTVFDGRTEMARWVNFDLDAPIQEHRVGLSDEDGRAPTRDDPMMVVIATQGEFLLFNDSFTPTCSSPWVEVTGEALEAFSPLMEGMGDTVDGLGVPIADALVSGAGEAVARGEGAYTVQVPSLDVIRFNSFLASNPDAFESLEQVDVDAEVVIADGVIESVTVDVGPALAVVTDTPVDAGQFAIVYEVDAAPDRPAIEVPDPDEVADLTCLGP